MENKKFTKEQLINGWNKACEQAGNDTFFSTRGSTDEPIHILTIENGLNLEITSNLRVDSSSPSHLRIYSYYISVLLEEVISYCTFEIDESEYKQLTNLFHKKELKFRAETKERIIKECVKKLEDFLE